MDSAGVHLWLILWKAFDSVREHATRHIHSLGIGLSDFGILEVLLHKGPLPVNTIGTRMRLTSGSITAAVDRLEQKGLVERRHDPTDRRARMAVPPPESSQRSQASAMAQSRLTVRVETPSASAVSSTVKPAK